MEKTPFILFFDCYIISSQMPLDQYYQIEKRIGGTEDLAIRQTDTVYRHVAKIDVVKYTLLSYMAVPWDDVVIRVECEDEADRVEFFAFARKYLPWANVVNQRSATAQAYYEALLPLKAYGNPWIFFTPNNDHPLVGAPENFRPLLDLAEEVERIYPGHIIGTQFSHFTESQLCTSPDKFLWLYYAGIIASEIGETDNAFIVQTNKFCCDSDLINRLDDLLMMFSESTNTGRCIRLEETGHYLGTRFKNIMIIPKKELCRHFDGYKHVRFPVAPHLLPTAPLFIPPGFFESQIKIRYGYDNREDGCVNVNPYEEYSYHGGVADIRSLLSELPAFWKKRIVSIDINPRMHELYARRPEDSFQFASLRNPYGHIFVLSTYKRSAWKAAFGSLHHFDESICQAENIIMGQGERRLDSTTASTSAVYFLLAGTVLVNGKQFRKNDLVVFRGECQFLFEAVSDISVMKVQIQSGGTPLMMNLNWQDIQEAVSD